MNRREVAGVLSTLAAAYERDITPEQLELWGDHLQGVSAELGAEAAWAHIRDSIWFPTIAEMLARVAVVEEQHARARRPRHCACGEILIGATDKESGQCFKCRTPASERAGPDEARAVLTHLEERLRRGQGNGG